MYLDAAVEEMDYDYEQNAAWSLARKELLSRFPADEPIAVLDVGCHTGLFLDGLPVAWLRHGIESANAPRNMAVQKHSVRVIAGRIEEIQSQWDGRFDVVTMFDVAEHLLDPAAALATAQRMLKPGGILLLSTADLDAWTWRWLGAGHWYLQTPQHLAVLSRKFLHYLERKRGFRLLDLRAIPHRRASRSVRLHDAVKALYWGMRLRRGVWRIPHRILQSLPGLRGLRHMQSVPWTVTLKDHFLCIYQRVDPA